MLGKQIFFFLDTLRESLQYNWSHSFLFPNISLEKFCTENTEEPQEYAFPFRVFTWSVCTDKWAIKAGCFPPPTHIPCLSMHILQERYSDTAVTVQLLLHSCLALPPAAGGSPLFIWILPARLLLAFQWVQYLCWQNTCYLKLINPHPAGSRRKFFIFVTQELCAVRSEALLTKSTFCSSCLLQIDLLFFKHMDIFQNIHMAMG